MLIHASIPADDPERVARVIAEVWRGEYFPFLFPQTFLVMAGDERGSTIDVAPRGKEIVPEEARACLSDSMRLLRRTVKRT